MLDPNPSCLEGGPKGGARETPWLQRQELKKRRTLQVEPRLLSHLGSRDSILVTQTFERLGPVVYVRGRGREVAASLRPA